MAPPIFRHWVVHAAEAYLISKVQIRGTEVQAIFGFSLPPFHRACYYPAKFCSINNSATDAFRYAGRVTDHVHSSSFGRGPAAACGRRYESGSAADVPARPAGRNEKLDFLIGQWKGEFAPGQRRTFNGIETVQSKLDGLLLAIEGLHRAGAGDKGQQIVVHSAFTVMSYDDKAKRYRFQAFTGGGNYEDAEAKVSDGRLEWGMKVPRFGDVRYTIKLDDKGRWFEIGEVSRDGTTWRQYFEMTLQRVDAK